MIAACLQHAVLNAMLCVDRPCVQGLSTWIMVDSLIVLGSAGSAAFLGENACNDYQSVSLSLQLSDSLQSVLQPQVMVGQILSESLCRWCLWQNMHMQHLLQALRGTAAYSNLAAPESECIDGCWMYVALQLCSAVQLAHRRPRTFDHEC